MLISFLPQITKPPAPHCVPVGRRSEVWGPASALHSSVLFVFSTFSKFET